jgi:cobalamin synthase
MSAFRKEIRYFLVALQFLTRVPVPRFDSFESAWLDRATKYFPLAARAGEFDRRRSRRACDRRIP